MGNWMDVKSELGKVIMEPTYITIMKNSLNQITIFCFFFPLPQINMFINEKY